MNTCSDEHAGLLTALHERDPNFGVIGYLWAPRVAAYMEELDAHSILDYGCGRSNLVPAVVERLHALGRSCQRRQEYDPATAPGTPDPAEFVTVIDVMEHVEADKIDAVLADILRCTIKAGLITISLRNGTMKNRRTHPNVHSREWWKDKLRVYFDIAEVPILDLQKATSELAVLVRPK